MNGIGVHDSGTGVHDQRNTQNTMSGFFWSLREACSTEDAVQVDALLDMVGDQCSRIWELQPSGADSQEEDEQVVPAGELKADHEGTTPDKERLKRWASRLPYAEQEDLDVGRLAETHEPYRELCESLAYILILGCEEMRVAAVVSLMQMQDGVLGVNTINYDSILARRG